MNKYINYFLQGLLYIVPITVTGAVVIWGFNKIDKIIPSLLDKLGIDMHIPGLGLIIIILLITMIGFAGATIIKSPINSFFQSLNLHLAHK